MQQSKQEQAVDWKDLLHVRWKTKTTKHCKCISMIHNQMHHNFSTRCKNCKVIIPLDHALNRRNVIPIQHCIFPVLIPQCLIHLNKKDIQERLIAAFRQSIMAPLWVHVEIYGRLSKQKTANRQHHKRCATQSITSSELLINQRRNYRLLLEWCDHSSLSCPSFCAGKTGGQGIMKGKVWHR